MNTMPRWLKGIFALAFLLFAAGGTWSFHIQEQQVKTDVEAKLAAIARLKVEQIVWWRAERLSDAAMDIIHPEDLAPAKKVFLQALRGERGYVREYRVRRKDGQYAWVQERSQIKRAH